jgi:8-oxo-dGTP pyrophosphatase MutT (NUDIX family)
MPDLTLIHRCVASHTPALVAPPVTSARTAGPGLAEDTLEAAVALVVHQPSPERPAELLFIERARRTGDPWSGHMAFPGGRNDPADADLEETARRETYEEVGLALGAPLGRLDDFAGLRPVPLHTGHAHAGAAARHLRVGAFVYAVPARPSLVLNEEVESTIWVPLDWIAAKASASESLIGAGDTVRQVPGFRYGHRLVWGLTYRILRSFYGVLGHHLPFETDT